VVCKKTETVEDSEVSERADKDAGSRGVLVSSVTLLFSNTVSVVEVIQHRMIWEDLHE
jgi:hypothetical protein